MVEIYEDRLVYVPVEEKNTVNKLFNIKKSAAEYYKNGCLVGYHWILQKETIAKLKLKAK